jgi:hypothetical protein
MQAYNIDTVKNSLLKKKAAFWHANKLISDQQFATILNHYSSTYKSSNVFVKIGLFIFICFIVLASLGIYSLLFSSIMYNSDNNIGFWVFTCFLYASACFIILEYFIKNKNIYNSGTDEALLYIGLIFLAVDIYLIVDEISSDSPLLFLFTALPFITFAVIRYADRIATLALSFCVYTILFLVIMKFGDVAKLIMPFVMMLFSAVLYFQIKKVKTKTKLFYWKSCMEAVEFLSLIIFYMACNYYVIRESSIEFFNMDLQIGEDIPLAFIFYILTANVPLGYIYFGLKQKDKTLLWSGLVLLAASSLTFKYYFSLGHPEIALTAAGIVLIGVSYFAIKYFKTPKHGITFEEQIDEDSFLKTNAEALIIVETLTQKNTPLTQNGVDFGGGQSGGAGSGGSY